MEEVFASAARTATVNGADRAFRSQGFYLKLDVTAVTATPAVTLELQIKDDLPASDEYHTVWAAAVAVAATGNFIYYVGVGAVDAIEGDLTEVANRAIPAFGRIRAVHGDADSITYSLGIIGANLGSIG